MKINLFKKSHLAYPPNEQSPNHRIGRDAFIDWVLMFNTFLIFSAVLIFVGFMVYVNMDEKLELSPTGVGSNLPDIDASLVEKVHTTFEARKLERAVILNGYKGTGDPSL